MGIPTAFAKNILDFADRNRVPVLSAIVLAAAVLASSALLHSGPAPVSQPIKPASTHAAVKTTDKSAASAASDASTAPSPSPTPAPSAASKSSAQPKNSAAVPTSVQTVTTAPPSNVATAVTPPPAPSPTPAPSPSPTPTPAPDTTPFDPAADILQVPLGGSSQTITLATKDGSGQYWSPGAEAFSWSDDVVPADKPDAPEYLVMEYPVTDGPYFSPSVSFHIHSTAASVVGTQGQTWIAIGDWTKGAPVFLQINYEVAAQ